jgi:hypothetical protein
MYASSQYVNIIGISQKLMLSVRHKDKLGWFTQGSGFSGLYYLLIEI